MENYLNLTAFHQRAVELVPGFLCVCAGLKCHKAKTLWYTAEVTEVGGEWESGAGERRDLRPRGAL